MLKLTQIQTVPKTYLQEVKDNLTPLVLALSDVCSLEALSSLDEVEVENLLVLDLSNSLT